VINCKCWWIYIPNTNSIAILIVFRFIVAYFRRKHSIFNDVISSNYNQLRNLSVLRLKIDLLSKLKIDTLELNFYGGAHYTDITPSPDFISNQFIRYTNVQKIHNIEQDGLDVVCSFDQPSGKQQARSSLIWTFISLLIGGIGIFYKLASQIHNEKKQSK
jgi:hypothetical protein